MLLDAARTPLPCWCWFRGLWHDKLAWHILLLCEMASEFDVGRDCRRQEPSGDACAVGCSTNYGWVPHSLFCLGLTLTAWHVILRAWMPWNWRLKHGRSRGSWQVEFFDIPFASICLKMTDIVHVFDMCLIFFEFLCFSVFFAFFICIVTDIRIIAYIRVSASLFWFPMLPFMENSFKGSFPATSDDLTNSSKGIRQPALFDYYPFPFILPMIHSYTAKPRGFDALFESRAPHLSSFVPWKMAMAS